MLHERSSPGGVVVADEDDAVCLRGALLRAAFFGGLYVQLWRRLCLSSIRPGLAPVMCSLQDYVGACGGDPVFARTGYACRAALAAGISKAGISKVGMRPVSA